MQLLLFPWRCLVWFWRWEWTPDVLLTIFVFGGQGLLGYIAWRLSGFHFNGMWVAFWVILCFNWAQANVNRVFVPSHTSYLRISRKLYWDEIREYTCFYRVTHEYWLGKILTVDDAVEIPYAEVIATDRPLAHLPNYEQLEGMVPQFCVHYRGQDYLATYH